MTGLSFGLGSAEDEGSSPGREGEEGSSDIGEGGIEKVPLQEYLWWKVFNLSVDQVETAAQQCRFAHHVYILATLVVAQF